MVISTVQKTTIEWQSGSPAVAIRQKSLRQWHQPSLRLRNSRLCCGPPWRWSTPSKEVSAKDQAVLNQIRLAHHNILQTRYKPSQSKQDIRYPGIRWGRLRRHMQTGHFLDLFKSWSRLLCWALSRTSCAMSALSSTLMTSAPLFAAIKDNRPVPAPMSKTRPPATSAKALQ